MDAELSDLREPERPCELDRADADDVPEPRRSRWGRGFDILRERLQHDLDTSEHCEQQRGKGPRCDDDDPADDAPAETAIERAG